MSKKISQHLYPKAAESNKRNGNLCPNGGNIENLGELMRGGHHLIFIFYIVA